eukprot:PITA_04937
MCYVVNQLSQAMAKTTKLYWKASKYVLRYLKGTTQYGLWDKQIEEVKLQGFTDAYWVEIPSDRKSTLGGIFSIGSTTISWYNRKQRSVALSSVEAEYIVAIQAACDAIWRRIMFLEYIPTEEQDADCLTKALSRCKFKFHRDMIEVVDNPFLVEREW